MTREELERWTKLYLVQQCNIPKPDHKEVDHYIEESIKYFGSVHEYEKVLKWFFKLDK